MLLCFLFLAALGATGAVVLLRQPEFGALPEGARLEAVRRSPHYADGRFANLIPTRSFSKDGNLLSTLVKNFLLEKKRTRPSRPLPAVKTDFAGLAAAGDVLVWLGHSSYYLQLDGKRILIDPVLSDHASPLGGINTAFPAAVRFTVADLPVIDCLLVSHDHWDHLDYPTVAALRDKVRDIVCPLGLGAYFAYWGYPEERIHEADWFESVALAGDLAVHVLPARHFSGRLLRRNKTLWAGFALTTPRRRVFFSGDSGYGPHFADIGGRFGGFDAVMLDCGQYDRQWAFMHMTPEEAAQAAEDLGARALDRKSVV